MTDAAQKRNSLPAENQFPIQELLAMPPYWGWVDCAADDNCRFRMLLGGNDDGVALRFFWNGGYEKATLRTWSRLARKTKMAIDIGAHTGVYTLAACAANPTIAVASFEPHFMNYARLNLNLRANNFSTANAFMMAVGAADATMPFSIRTGLDYLTTGGKLGAADKAITMPVLVRALDGFFVDAAKSAIGLVKIDVEGFEGECLAGMRAIVERASPTIFFECIDEKSGAAVQSFLAPLGYSFFEIDDIAGTITKCEHITPIRDAQGQHVMHRLNRIATKNEDVLKEA